VAILLLILAVAAVYQGTLSCPFIFDDDVWILWNPSIRHAWPPWGVLSPAPGSPVYGRPVLSLSLALNYAVGGEGPGGYHLANACIHAMAALALFGVVRRTLAFVPGTFRSERDRIVPAFAAALIWAVHPLQTEAVTYVIQRAESLMGLFYLLALYSLIRALQAGGALRWNLLCVLFCLLGMGVKQVMVTAPVVLLAYDRTFAAGSFGGALRLRWRLYLGLALTWLPLLGLGAGMRDPGVGFALGYAWWAYGLTECWVVTHYILLAFWPHPLVFDYGTDIVARVGEALPWLCVLVALLGVSLIAFMRRTAIGFAAAWFFAILAPSSSIVPVAFAPMAESRMYLPLAAVVTVLVAGCYAWMGRRSLWLFAGAALALGIGARIRNHDYRSEVSIWSDTVAKRPSNPRAHLALGSALAVADRNEEAREQFAATLRIDPGDFEARRNLGYALYRLGRPAEALAEYRRLVATAQGSEALHFDIALALDSIGRTDESIEEFGMALRINPDDGEARTDLGGVFFRAGRNGEAAVQFGLALRELPDSARVHFNLGLALERMGGIERAMEQYREAVRIDPRYAEARANLGGLLAGTGRVPEAIEQYEEALRIRPDYEVARSSLKALRDLQAAKPAVR
jgi:tetratricopeptide (TPR) repeat protein